MKKEMILRKGYGHMVQDYYVNLVREMRAERSNRLKSIRTRGQAEEYRDQVRRAIRKAFAPVPAGTPLNAKTTGILERPGYRIEKVIFESRPRCLVTANLYLPDGIREPSPGVIATCGHFPEGKAAVPYQELALRLLKAGIATLVYDPVNQGERDQYLHLPSEHPLRTNCCQAHNMLGKQMELAGDFFGTWRVWDGIRALDYLLTRPEVDRRRVGVTGCSGGGTLTTWLWALEERFTMAAPSCFITTFAANLENELPADCEQYPPGILGAGLEMADFLLARAPDPAVLLGERYDYFDPRGLKETYREMKRFYRLFRAERNARLFIGNEGHGYCEKCQRTMVSFFSLHSNLPKPDDRVSLTREKRETLFATPTGQVVPAGSRPIYERLAETARELSAARKKLSPAALKSRLTALLGIAIPHGAPHYRILQPLWLPDAMMIARFAVETERDIRVIVRKGLIRDRHAYTFEVAKEALVYLPHRSAEEDMAGDSLPKSLLKKEILYAVDLRGLGESLPDDTLDFYYPYGLDYMYHGHGIMFGKSYLGGRVYDAMRTIDLLTAKGARSISLFGRGQGAVVALFTAVLRPGAVKRVVLKNAPISCEEWLKSPVVLWPAASFLRGMLKEFDLPDCIRALGGRIALVEPWGPDMKPLGKNRMLAAMKAAGLSKELLNTETKVLRNMEAAENLSQNE